KPASQAARSYWRPAMHWSTVRYTPASTPECACHSHTPMPTPATAPVPISARVTACERLRFGKSPPRIGSVDFAKFVGMRRSRVARIALVGPAAVQPQPLLGRRADPALEMAVDGLHQRPRVGGAVVRRRHGQRRLDGQAEVRPAEPL